MTPGPSEGAAKPSHVFVLGHQGMLGHVVARYLEEKGHRIVTSDERYEGGPRDALIEAVRASECGWVVNAIGRIPQRCSDPAELFQANTLLPLHLRARTLPSQRILHASTDCVFSGRRGPYRVDEPGDAEEVYGLSKLMGEAIALDPRCTVVRTSIIGPERSGGHGLMGWFLAQREGVRGYVNHLWNGITTLEWAKIASELIGGELASGGVLHQPGTTDALSKHELLELIGEVWEHPLAVAPVTVEPAVDRRLVPTLTRPPLRTQLDELRHWYQAK